MEGVIAFARLFERFPGLRLAVPAENLVYWDGTILHGLASLPVHLGEEAHSQDAGPGFPGCRIGTVIAGPRGELTCGAWHDS